MSEDTDSSTVKRRRHLRYQRATFAVQRFDGKTERPLNQLELVMMRHFTLIIALLLSSTSYALDQTWLILETAPSPILMKNMELSASVAAGKDWFWHGQFGHHTFKDRDNGVQGIKDNVGLSLQYYPKLFATQGPFMGLGMQIDHTQNQHERLRPSRTYFKPEDASNVDTWVSDTYAASLTQRFGYRINLGPLLSTSAGVDIAEILHSQTNFSDLNLMPDSSPEALDRARVSLKFFLNMGIYFQ